MEKKTTLKQNKKNKKNKTKQNKNAKKTNKTKQIHTKSKQQNKTKLVPSQIIPSGLFTSH
jgi:hypothetical protein